MRKILAVAGIAALALTGCGRADDTTTGASGSASASVNPADITVGVAMPTKTSERWIKDGDYMKQQLEAAGYKVNLQYANDDIPTQVSQVNDMVTKGNQVLVVLSISGRGGESGVPVAQELAVLWTFEGERAVQARSFTSRAEAFEAAGKEEPPPA